MEENRYAVDMSKKYEWGWKSVDNVVSLRSKEWKLICTANGRIVPAYLFDLVNDPMEERNLIKDIRYHGLDNEYKQELMDMLKDDIQYKYGSIKDEVKSNKEDNQGKEIERNLI